MPYYSKLHKCHHECQIFCICNLSKNQCGLGPQLTCTLGPWPVLTSLFYICILSKNQCVLGPSVGLYLGALTSLNLHMHLIKMRSGAPQLACTLEPWHVLTSLLDATASSFVTADVFFIQGGTKKLTWHQMASKKMTWVDIFTCDLTWRLLKVIRNGTTRSYMQPYDVPVFWCQN